VGNIEKPHQSAGATQRQRLVPELIFWAPQFNDFPLSADSQKGEKNVH